MREFYNAEFKSQFIDSLPQYENERIKKNYENLFYSISTYERQLNKDFCDMNVPETKMVILSLEILSTSSLLTIITLLRDYNNWCIANGKTNYENSLLKIKTVDFDLSFSISSKLIESPKKLNEILVSAFGDDATPFQKQSKLIAWLLYYGFSVEQIKHLTRPGINAFKESISKTAQDYNYYDMILDLMEDCDKMHEVRTITARHNTEKIDYLIDSEYMIRSKTNSRSDPSGMISDTIILNRIRDINTQYSTNTGMRIELTIDRIIRSGIFYRLYQFEKENGSVNRDIIKKLFGIDYQSNFTVSNEISKKKKDYDNWKKAFEL